MWRYLFLCCFLGVGINADAADNSVHCLRGKKEAQSSFSELTLSVEGKKIMGLDFQSEIGPSLSGSFFGCSMTVARNEISWADTETTTVILLKDKERVIITRSENGYKVDFDVDSGNWCGVQAAMPYTIIILGNTGQCEIQDQEV